MRSFCKPYREFTFQKVTQGFKSDHQALDCVSYYGTPLVATEDGVVVSIVTPNKLLDKTDNEHIRRGYGIVLKGKSGLYTLFWHCQGVFPVDEGDEVVQGQIVAYMGNSGFVYSLGQYVPVEIRSKAPYAGTHVHWEVYEDIVGIRKYLNPIEYVDWNLDMKYEILVAAKVVLRKILNLLGK